MKQAIGHIISGSLSEGFTVRLQSADDLQRIKTGKFVSIMGHSATFFSLITDIQLNVTHPDIALFPPHQEEFFLRHFIASHGLQTLMTIRPMLMLDEYHQKLPVKTIPHHFAPVFEASAQDVAAIFGDEHDETKRYFNIGTPLDMETPVCINLEALTERSNGIFGKTGTGKTFLTRLVLAGLIKQEKAVNLIFDMHSEYGLQARQEGQSRYFVKGLKTLFPDKVVIFSLDPASTRRRGGSPDATITLNYESIHVQDILSLQEELNLHATACEAAYLLSARYKERWLAELLAHGDTIKECAESIGAHPESLAALYRKLKKIERLPFFTAHHQQDTTIIDSMIRYIDKGISVIIEFGNYTSTFCYLLLANIITRRIHELYIKKTERFLGSQKKEDEPKKLLITIEEAHKFLNPQAARQTIFGTIAREMRKYYVSLLVVDQRPSGIDPEIISQIGTKIAAQLNDEKDIAATLTGAQNATQLRSVLSSLDSKKQVLIFGHAVAMPVVVETRSYDEQFYKDMQLFAHKDMENLVRELF